jgi:hypothetical protein
MHIDVVARNFSETEYESTSSKKRSRWFRFADPRMETSMIATTTLTEFSNGRHAPQAAAPSPSCPIAEFWGSGSLTAQRLTGQSSPFSTVTGRNEFAMGRRPLSPWAPYPPRHAQPGIHEYTAQTLADG